LVLQQLGHQVTRDSFLSDGNCFFSSLYVEIILLHLIMMLQQRW